MRWWSTLQHNFDKKKKNSRAQPSLMVVHKRALTTHIRTLVTSLRCSDGLQWSFNVGRPSLSFLISSFFNIF